MGVSWSNRIELTLIRFDSDSDSNRSHITNHTILGRIRFHLRLCSVNGVFSSESLPVPLGSLLEHFESGPVQSNNAAAEPEFHRRASEEFYTACFRAYTTIDNRMGCICIGLLVGRGGPGEASVRGV